MVITVSCPSCQASFPVDPDKIPAGGVRVRCSACAHVFRVEKPEPEAGLAPESAAAGSVAPEGATVPAPAGGRSLEEPGPEAPDEGEPGSRDGEAAGDAVADAGAGGTLGTPDSGPVAPAYEGAATTEGGASQDTSESAPAETEMTGFQEFGQESSDPSPVAFDDAAPRSAEPPPAEPWRERDPFEQGPDLTEGEQPPPAEEALTDGSPHQGGEAAPDEATVATEGPPSVDGAAADTPFDLLPEGPAEEVSEVAADAVPDLDGTSAQPAAEASEPAAEAQAAPGAEASAPAADAPPEPAAGVSEPVTDAPPEPAPGLDPAADGAGPAEPDRPSAAPVQGFTFGKRDPTDKARRLARVLVSDMIMYNAERHQIALAQGTLAEDFEEEIDKSWKEYVDQVGAGMAEGEGRGFWVQALNDILAKGREVF